MKIRFENILEMISFTKGDVQELKNVLTIIGENRTLLKLKEAKEEVLKNCMNTEVTNLIQELEKIERRIEEDERALEALEMLKTRFFIKAALEVEVEWNKKTRKEMLETEIEIEI